ncbi:MAG: hypothetical protein M1308_12925 [Actinobacteria bacterium]|nr:hypothetical protein [Actinomycetota bacterium]
MNSREKFNAIMNFEKDAPNLKAEFAYWAQTIRNWFREGLPVVEEIPENILDGEVLRGSKPLALGINTLVDKNVIKYFHLDSYIEKFPFDISPMIDEKIIFKDEHYKIFIDNFGRTQKIINKVAATPIVLNYPIKNRKDFYNYIQLYNSNDFTHRLPKDFENLTNVLKERDFPIRLGGNPFGFSFLARYLMGEINFMLNLYDDPVLIKEFNEFFLNYLQNYWSKILEKVDIDCVFILEDMAYRTGSFISKEMFKEFMAPYYIKLIDFLKQFKITNIFVDCDGLINELIPLWIEVGVTGIFPIEAVNDVGKIRNNYPNLKLLGGVNKKVLFADSNKTNIDLELGRISKVIKTGGFIPHIDHAVSADVTWENFKYYRLKLNDMIDKLSKL